MFAFAAGEFRGFGFAAVFGENVWQRLQSMCRGEFPVRGSSNVTVHLGLGSLERSDDFEFCVFDCLMQRAFRRAFRTIDA